MRRALASDLNTKRHPASAADVVSCFRSRQAHPNFLVERDELGGPKGVPPSRGSLGGPFDDGGLEKRRPREGLLWIHPGEIHELAASDVNRTLSGYRGAPGPGLYDFAESRGSQGHPEVSALFEEDVSARGSRDRVSDDGFVVVRIGCHVGGFPST